MKTLEELKLKNKKVIIFDLDGTLIDSIGIWNMTDQKLIQEYSNKTIKLEKIQEVEAQNLGFVKKFRKVNHV